MMFDTQLVRGLPSNTGPQLGPQHHTELGLVGSRGEHGHSWLQSGWRLAWLKTLGLQNKTKTPPKQ